MNRETYGSTSAGTKFGRRLFVRVCRKADVSGDGRDFNGSELVVVSVVFLTVQVLRHIDVCGLKSVD